MITMNEIDGATRGKQLLKARDCDGRPRTCPGCGLSVSGSAVINLLYTFEACDCEFVHYTHLAERVWHRKCFLHQEGGQE